MKARTVITNFWAMAAAGKSAALDINCTTGELALRCTRSTSGELGNGIPPTTYSDDWARIVTSLSGRIIKGAER